MDKFTRAYFDKSLTPNRIQHLVVSDSKHLFFRESDEVVRYQKKELDPRTCGNRKMLARVVAIDEDTGVFYGELWRRDKALDLIGFLARVWARKTDHPMRGVPRVLCVSSSVLKSAPLADQVVVVAKLCGAQIAPSPGGFGSATVAAREYERELTSTLADYRESFVLRAPHMAAQEISFLGCSNAITAFRESWEACEGISAEVMKRIDERYDPVGYWRGHDFERFVVAPNALPSRTTTI